MPKEDVNLSLDNRAFRYGDGVFETMRVIHTKIMFWESHYLRLMANMRILRMEIPMVFTMEYFQEEIDKLLVENSLEKDNVRIRLQVYREGEGYYNPNNPEIGFVIEAAQLNESFFVWRESPYKVGLYKDNYIAKDFLSTVKSTNRIKNVLAGIFAEENGFDNCIMLNTDKQVIEAVNGNLFLVVGNQIQTPPLTDGCINGIIRKQLIEIIKLIPELRVEEVSISPFALQKADALFITNAVVGIQPIYVYKKKVFQKFEVVKDLLVKLNTKARISD